MAVAFGDFRLSVSDLSWTGQGLRRPECVLALRDGSLLASDRAGIATRIAADGSQSDHGSGARLANTFALDDAGGLIVADLERGAILGLGAEGPARLLHDQWQGAALGAVNFCLAGAVPDEFYISVSTPAPDFRTAIRDPRPDGRIYRLDPAGLSLCATGLWFPNAMQLDATGDWLYLAETTAGAVARAPRRADGTLGPVERFGPAPFWPGAYTDGLALDVAGNVWVTELSRNAIVVLTPDGEAHTVFEDPEGTVLQAPTHLAFGGPDLRRLHIGSLRLDRIPNFLAPVAGVPMRHWQRATEPAFLRGAGPEMA